MARSSYGLAPDRPEQDEVLVSNIFQVGPTTPLPGPPGERLGESDDVARTPAQRSTET
jgi:hypothetical protein